MNRKSISGIVNIYNPLQIRETIICYCSGHEGEGTYSMLVCTIHMPHRQTRRINKANKTWAYLSKTISV